MIEKRDGEKVTDRCTGTRYGPHTDFEPYAAQTGMQMGFMNAEQTLFIPDRAREQPTASNHGRYRVRRLPDRQRLGGRRVQVFVAGRRFRDNGMRWGPHDNECVLRTRLAGLNGDLQR